MHQHRTVSAIGIAIALMGACDSADDAPVRDSSVEDPGSPERDAGVDRPQLELCSGCESERPAVSDPTFRVHHVHLNVKSVRETVDFYVEFFGAKPVWLNDREVALWTDPILLLLDEVDGDLPDALEMGLEHIGLGVEDPVQWFEEASARGLGIDTRNGGPAAPVSTPLLAAGSPFFDPGVDTFAYVYVRGPNHERIEVWSGLDRFRHVHFMTHDVEATIAWYAQLLNAKPLAASVADNFGLGNGLAVGEGVQLFYASMPPIAEFVPTDDRPVGHIAFSVTHLDALFARTEQLSLSVVSGPARSEHGFRSFFLRGPNQVLLEFVEAGPVSVR